MEYLIQDTTLTGIADAIRAKTGGTDPIPVTDMATQIAAITGGGSEETLTTLFEEKPCNGFSLDSTYGVYTVNVGSAYTLVVGESYIVEWDGETYNCVAQDLSFLAAGVVGLGNFADFGGTGNGEPFGFLYSATGCTICALDTATAHDVGLYQRQSSGGSVEGIVYVTFMNGSVELCKTACMVGDCSIDPVECAKIAVPTKEPTVDTVYTYAGGWSLTDGGEADEMALIDVTEDRVVYAPYTESVREYTINFWLAEGELHESLQVPYGQVPIPTAPTKDGYVFSGWTPTLVAVNGDADYYAGWEENFVASGTCGTSATWSLTGEGTLTVYGTGQMTIFSDQTKVPWKNYVGQIKSVVISDGITYIGPYSFYDCTALTSVEIPESVGTVGCGYYTFYGCTSLTEIEFPDSVTGIGRNIFQGCTALTSFTVKAAVTSIGIYAFSGCTALSSVVFEDPSGWKRKQNATEYDITWNTPSSNATRLASTYASNSFRKS